MPNRIKAKRESGILLPLSALPAEYGVGTLGEEAYRFVDFLHAAGQRYWQLLPLTPSGSGHSPYSPQSAFAGELLYIDIPFLIRDGFLPAAYREAPAMPQMTDYDAAETVKIPLLREAARRFNTKKRDYRCFLAEQKDWVFDYALFAAIKEVYGAALPDFPEELKYRLPDALARFEEEHAEETEFYKITQYFFYTQYFALHNYARKKGVQLIGDLPFYMQLDCADVWTTPGDFKVGRDFTPLLVSGAPPDEFAKRGQIWNHPIYDFAEQKRGDYRFWKRRFHHAALLYDVIRLDHFRAFSEYYVCAYGAKDAITGYWQKGVGFPFFKAVEDALKIPVIAEDLGGETEGVRRLLEQTGFPGTRVLQFAFDGNGENEHLPQNHPRNCVCYTGTHDNDTIRGFVEHSDRRQRALIAGAIGISEPNLSPFDLIRFCLSSRAKIAIVPIQDYLQLDSSARLNTPGIAEGNWRWRLPQDVLDEDLCKTVKKLTFKRR